jgi:predicted peptidase
MIINFIWGWYIKIKHRGNLIACRVNFPKSTSLWKYPKESVSKLTIISPLDYSQTESLDYLVSLPTDYNTTAKKYPLILFLHGAFERGNNVFIVPRHGPLKYFRKNPDFAKTNPFIIVAPQCKRDHYWSHEQMLLLLDEVERKFRVDSSRIYATGFSLGGYGAYMLAAESPKRFAAVVPICGGYLPSEAAKLCDVSLWIFHGDRDPTVPVTQAMNMAEAIKNAGGRKTKVAIYPNVGHNIWTQTYCNPDLYNWLLTQTNGSISSIYSGNDSLNK